MIFRANLGFDVFYPYRLDDTYRPGGNELNYRSLCSLWTYDTGERYTYFAGKFSWSVY